jgi:hypothetical protein
VRSFSGFSSQFSSINQLFFLLFSSLFSVLLQQLIDAAVFCKTSNTSPLCCTKKKTANKLTVSQPKTAAPLLLKVAEKSSLVSLSLLQNKKKGSLFSPLILSAHVSCCKREFSCISHGSESKKEKKILLVSLLLYQTLSSCGRGCVFRKNKKK